MSFMKKVIRAMGKRPARARPTPTPPVGAKIGRGPMSLAVPVKGMARAPRAPIPFGKPPRRRSPTRAKPPFKR
jgi:hypothetical protein